MGSHGEPTGDARYLPWIPRGSPPARPWCFPWAPRLENQITQKGVGRLKACHAKLYAPPGPPGERHAKLYAPERADGVREPRMDPGEVAFTAL